MRIKQIKRIREKLKNNQVSLGTWQQIPHGSISEILGQSKNKFFDYQAKYSKGYSKHILPAKISKKNYYKCLQLAKKSHYLLGCNSIARTDFILNTKNNKIFFLETNTQPGLTSVSLLPEQAKFRNISFEMIILEILKQLN